MIARVLKEVINTTKIQEIFAKIKAWVTQNGMVFNQAKFEKIHFFYNKYIPNLDIISLLAIIANVIKTLQIVTLV